MFDVWLDHDVVNSEAVIFGWRSMLLASGRYFDFDPAFAREVLGRKLAKVRKELEDISERVAIPLVSCQRQFDNIRAVYRFAVDDDEKRQQHSTTRHAVIEREFLLPGALAR